MIFTFGDIVIVDGENLGVVVKCWNSSKGCRYEVYVRMDNAIKDYPEANIRRYLVRHKYLSKEEKEYQRNAEWGL